MKEEYGIVTAGMQYDYMPSGNCPIKGSEKIIPGINHLLEVSHHNIILKDIMMTEYHESGNYTFEADMTDFDQEPYCVEGSDGAQIIDSLYLDKMSILIKNRIGDIQYKKKAKLDNRRLFNLDTDSFCNYLLLNCIETIYFCGIFSVETLQTLFIACQNCNVKPVVLNDLLILNDGKQITDLQEGLVNTTYRKLIDTL